MRCSHIFVRGREALTEPDPACETGSSEAVVVAARGPPSFLGRTHASGSVNAASPNDRSNLNTISAFTDRRDEPLAVTRESWSSSGIRKRNCFMPTPASEAC